MNGKGDKRRPLDKRFCSEEELARRWELAFAADKEEDKNVSDDNVQQQV